MIVILLGLFVFGRLLFNFRGIYQTGININIVSNHLAGIGQRRVSLVGIYVSLVWTDHFVCNGSGRKGFERFEVWSWNGEEVRVLVTDLCHLVKLG